jgi:hypothetical protein
MLIFEILLKGYFILFSAIFFNWLMGIFKIQTWYSFLLNFKNPKLKPQDVIFLFLIYPLFLGFLAFIVSF